MSPEVAVRGYAFISMLRDEPEARALAGLLEGLARSEATDASIFLVPDVRGLDFFAAPQRQAAVDRWWAAHVPPGVHPVFLLGHEAGLADWLGGLDGAFFVAAVEHELGAYRAWNPVPGDESTAALALAEAVVTAYGAAPDDTSGHPDVFDARDVRMIARIRAHAEASARRDQDGGGPPARPADARGPRPAGVRGSAADRRGPAGPTPALPPLFAVGGAAGGDRPAALDPLELLAAESAAREQRSPIWAPAVEARVPARPGASTALDVLRRVRLHPPGAGRAERVVADGALAALLLARPGRIVAVGSRKGGVGKTSHAAGMAISAGGILDSVGHTAALLDANIANPDAWGHLHIPPTVGTVRDLVDALATGRTPPPTVHATTPALACYPESRDGVEYTRTDIRRLAAHLRARHALVIVDMSNRLPDPTGGPEAAVAAYWLDEADALVLPTAMSRQDFNGVLDYLDVGGLPPTVVPCIVSGARRNRRHPMTLEYLSLIEARVARVLEVPDEADRIRLAGMDGVPVQQVSARMGVAYRELVEAVCRLPPRQRC